MEFVGISEKASALGNVDEGLRCQLLLQGVSEWIHAKVLTELNLGSAARHEFKWGPVLGGVKRNMGKAEAGRRVKEERYNWYRREPEGPYPTDPIKAADKV